MNRKAAGHMMALFTVIVWGTTFISTKILLVDFQPIEILFFRFLMGFAALFAACPHRLLGVTPRQEATFAAAGLCGVCLYYLLENIALTYTMASNVGVITSVAPIFTAILAHYFMKTEEKLGLHVFAGFAVSMTGIALISLNGARLQLNPLGDLLAVGSAFTWGCYSILSKKISGYGYPVLLVTRRIFFYGILLMMLALPFFDVRLGMERFANKVYLLNILYLGLGASALCFVTWNNAVKILGPVRTSIYIYMVPVVTIVTSVLILKERITWISVLGACLVVVGMLFAEHRGKEA